MGNIIDGNNKIKSNQELTGVSKEAKTEASNIVASKIEEAYNPSEKIDASKPLSKTDLENRFSQRISFAGNELKINSKNTPILLPKGEEMEIFKNNDHSQIVKEQYIIYFDKSGTLIQLSLNHDNEITAGRNGLPLALN